VNSSRPTFNLHNAYGKGDSLLVPHRRNRDHDVTWAKSSRASLWHGRHLSRVSAVVVYVVTVWCRLLKNKWPSSRVRPLEYKLRLKRQQCVMLGKPREQHTADLQSCFRRDTVFSCNEPGVSSSRQSVSRDSCWQKFPALRSCSFHGLSETWTLRASCTQTTVSKYRDGACFQQWPVPVHRRSWGGRGLWPPPNF